MAHVAKYTRGAIQGLSNHLDRKTENHSNKDIDTNQTQLNYDLCGREGDTIARFNERLGEVYCMNRKDVKAGADWLVTLPQELNDRTPEQQRTFFQETKKFLDDRYGEENCISANVHMDETQPHMHYAFIPVTYDEKKQREKVSAKIVLNRQDLKSFHGDLDRHLRENIPDIYQQGILNDKTVGVETTDELKKLQLREKELAKEVKTLKTEKEQIQTKLDVKRQELDEFQENKPRTIEKKNVPFQKRSVKVDVHELRNLELLASDNFDYKSLYERQSEENKALKKENQTLREKISDLEEKMKGLIKPIQERLNTAKTVIRALTKKYIGKERPLEYFENRLAEQENKRAAQEKDRKEQDKARRNDKKPDIMPRR